ncbi:hypothetical protein LMG26842_05787 [Achromobacter dolens]|uniref:S24 family peptidase n=1 Tax=Achromobacter dolens TaxID=1287738 RepID=UPI0014686AEE|nr:S24 family peptidase [Achromobacter dolens]CAB3909449.1 hypothetical protein LMG26842_05787 [Achromobacter dolens]
MANVYANTFCAPLSFWHIPTLSQWLSNEAMKLATTDEIRRSNLALLASRLGGNRQLADRIGKGESQLSQWINASTNSGTGKPRGMRSSTCREIESSLRLPQGWLDTPHAPDEAIPGGAAPGILRLPEDQGNVVSWESPEDLEPDEDRVWIDRYDYQLSAGTGMIQWEVRSKKALPFDAGFFRAIRSNPKDCKLLLVRGDSMEPYLFNRDLAMVDSSKTMIRDGKIYAVHFEDEPLVKQIFKQAGGGVTLHSYNGKYPDRTISADQMESLSIVGEVIYRSGSGPAGGN